MAKIVIKSGKRGRPLSIDPVEAIKDLFKVLPQVKSNLSQIRKETSGVRDERIFGSETELPDYIERTFDVLSNLRENEKISYENLRELKQDIRFIERLASRQRRVKETIFSDILFESYKKNIKFMSRYASKFTKAQYNKLITNIEKLTPSERQEFFLSVGYQDPMTIGTNDYQRVINYAETETGQTGLTKQEAFAYLIYRRQQDYLDTKGLQAYYDRL